MPLTNSSPSTTVNTKLPPEPCAELSVTDHALITLQLNAVISKSFPQRSMELPGATFVKSIPFQLTSVVSCTLSNRIKW